MKGTMVPSATCWAWVGVRAVRRRTKVERVAGKDSIFGVVMGVEVVVWWIAISLFPNRVFLAR